MRFLEVALPGRAGTGGSIDPICPASPEAGYLRSTRHQQGKVHDRPQQRRTKISVATRLETRPFASEPRVLEQKIHDGRRVLQAMRVVFAARLEDHLDRATEFPITLFEQRGVFRKRHRRIGIAAHGNDRHPPAGDQRNPVERVAAKGARLGAA